MEPMKFARAYHAWKQLQELTRHESTGHLKLKDLANQKGGSWKLHRMIKDLSDGFLELFMKSKEVNHPD
jgi:hypothetical protein